MCHGQVARSRGRMNEFEELGARLLIVDPHESLRVKHFLRFAGARVDDLHVPMLADSVHTVSATYGVAFQMRIHTEWSNRPATFVIDRAGIVRYEHRAKSFDDRPKPDEPLSVLKRIKNSL